MARPRRGSPEALINQANEVIARLLNDPKSPAEVKARLAVKVAEWVREDRKLEAQQVKLTAAREAELREDGKQQYLASLSQQMEAALREAQMDAPAYAAPECPAEAEHPEHFD